MPKFLNYLPFFVAVLLIANLSANQSTAAIQVSVVNQKVVTGTVARIRPGAIKIKQADGDVGVYKIQDKDERAISIGGTPVRLAAQIAVTGELPVKLAERGMLVQFTGRTSVYGKSEGELSSIEVLSGEGKPELKVEFLERPEGRDAGKVEVVGRVVSISGNRLQLQVPKSKWAKKERISFTVSDDCVLKIADDHLNRVQPNDIVVQANILEFSNGESAVNRIDIQMVPEREQITTSNHERLEQEFSLYSDEPGEPREMRSKHFVLYTDVSDRSANILLSKLETMYALVSGYFSARPNSVIECYVVSDLGKWPSGQLDPRGVAKIAEPAGVMSIAALDEFKDEIKGKTVVCLVSGSNNDITRTAEIKERALLYANLKHYFIIKFPQRPGALREFVVDMLGPHDDITHFEYTKKVNRENDVAVVGIQLKTQEDLQPLITKLKAHNFFGDYLNDKPELFQFLV